MDIKALVEKQREFFKTGATKNPHFRKKQLLKLADTIKKYEYKINQALKKDLNKSRMESYMCEVGLSLSEIHYLSRHVIGWCRNKYVPTPLAQFHSDSFIKSEPYGVALVMSPWNYPFMLTIEPLAAAISAGNCCIVKPSAYSPCVSAVIAEIIEAAFPPEYIAVVQGGRAENNELLEQRFDYIFFTGSVNVGKLVMEKASKHLTPVTLELGGKSPCIVDKDANIKLAARRIAFGKYLNSGQTCVAPDYLFIHKDVKKEFIKEFTFCVKNMFGENPLENKDFPKMINKKHFDRVNNLIKGEKVIIGGKSNESTLQIVPTLLDKITPDSPIMQEEIFGPVLPMMTFSDLDEVVDYVTAHEKPLACYLFTHSRKTERYILDNISFGGGCVNDTIIHLATSHMPFGGVGGSGMGGYHGKFGFDTFSHKKSVLRKYTWLDLPMRYQPYSDFMEKLVRIFVK